MQTTRSLSFLIQGIFIMVVLTGCPSLDQVIKPSPMDNFYRANGWTPLPIPDSKYGPGALIEITEKKDVRYWDNLSTCNVPADLLKPVDSTSPPLTFNQDATYNAEAVLQVSGVTAGPEYSKVKTVHLVHEEHGGDALKLLAIQIWLTDPLNAEKFPQACKDFFNDKNHFLVQEAYRVSKGKYTLLDKNNAQIKVSNLALGPVKIEPEASVSVNADGELLFDKTSYTALRNVRRLGGKFETLGTPRNTQRSDDAEIDTLLHDNNSRKQVSQ